MKSSGRSGRGLRTGRHYRASRAGVIGGAVSLLLLFGGCRLDRRGDPWSFGARMAFTGTFRGKGPTQSLAIHGPIRYPESTPSTPLVGRVGERGKETRLREPTPEETDGVLAFRLAGIAHRLLRDEVGMERPTLYVYLFPVSDPGTFRIKVPLTRTPGTSVGVPTREGELDPLHAFSLIFFLTHESMEAFMVYPALGGGARLYGDLKNRWIGEGMANLMVARALDEAAQQRLQISAVGFPRSAVEQYRAGKRAIRLEGWLPGQPDETRYAAAEYLCHRWYQAARRRGHRRPLAKFAAWLRTIPSGPTHRQVLDWLETTSGIPVGWEAKGVLIEEVIRYHLKRWAFRGWEAPADALHFEGDDLENCRFDGGRPGLG